MTIRDIFVPLAPAISFDPQLDAAARLAQPGEKRESGTRAQASI